MTATLRERIVAALDESTQADPAAVVASVVAGTDDADLREAFAVALTPLVRSIARQRAAMTASAEPPVVVAPPKGASRVASPKVAAVSQWWSRMLRERVSVGEGQWAFLGDMTYDQLVFAAEERRRQARFTQARAEAFGRLADLVDRNGAARVRDLPEPLLREAVPPALEAAA